MKKKKNIQSKYQKMLRRKICWLLLIGEGEKKHCSCKNTFMFAHSLHYGRKSFCRYCLHAFITEGILKRHFNDCFKINGKQTIKTPKKGEYVKFKNVEGKIKSPFMIYADFESILLPEYNG